MKKQNIVLIALSVLLYIGCKDQVDETSYTVSGHLYHDCSKNPISNTKVRLFQNADNGGPVAGGELATTVTDSTGYFKFEFQDNKGKEMTVELATGTDYVGVMNNIPARTSIDNLIIYQSVSTNIQVRLNVVNPYTSNDTLVISGYQTMQDLHVPGPFTSGELYTATNFPLLGMSYGGQSKNLSWYFAPYSGTHFTQPFNINKYCNDTIFVTATIN